MGPAVVALGAWCDYVDVKGIAADDEFGGGSTLRFEVDEFAVLSDGRRVARSEGLGWGSQASGRLDREKS